MKYTKKTIFYCTIEKSVDCYSISKIKSKSSAVFLLEIKSYLEELWRSGKGQDYMDLYPLTKAIGRGCLRSDIHFLSILYGLSKNSLLVASYDKKFLKKITGSRFRSNKKLPLTLNCELIDVADCFYQLISQFEEHSRQRLCDTKIEALHGIELLQNTLIPQIVHLEEESYQLCECHQEVNHVRL